MKHIVLALLFSLLTSMMSLAEPHPYLLQAAKEGRWSDFKNFLYEHPEEADKCDDSIFRLADFAGRMDVFDGHPAPCAPPREDEPAINNYNPLYPPLPTAPELTGDEYQEQEDMKLARRLQEQEYEAAPEYDYVEERQEKQRRKICNANDMIGGAFAALGAFVIWNLLDQTH